VTYRNALLFALAATLPFTAAAEARTLKPGPASDASGGARMDRYYHLGSRPLRRGEQGHDVKIAQDFLRRLGYRGVRVDGAYGRGTVKAVRTWEQANHRHVDGVLTAADFNVLRQGLAGNGPPAPPALTPGQRATVSSDGTASAPASAPPQVQAVIAVGNVIASKPYRWGGGHGRWNDTGYDCSGSVSYALHGADLLAAPRDSTGLERYGAAGAGQWVTIYANGGHAYMVVAGLRFDTSGANPSRWQRAMRPGSGFVVRHPAGL